MPGERPVREPDDYSVLDAKIKHWWEQMSKWFSDAVSWVTCQLANTFRAWGSLVKSWFNKIGSKLCRSEEKKAKKADKAKNHFENAKNKGKKVIKSAKTVVLGWMDTLGWAWKVALRSAQKSIKSMRSENLREAA